MRPRGSLALTLLLAAAPAPAAPTDRTLGLKPPEGATVLIGDSLDAWTIAGDSAAKAEWPVVRGVATVAKGSIRTADTFGDFQLHVEFNVPYLPDQKGQGRGNSGVYLQGIYELQVLDSYGLTPKNNDCGAIYQQIVPSVNACKPPLQWQTYDITFHAAQLDGDKVDPEGPPDRGPERPDDHRRQGDSPHPRRRRRHQGGRPRADHAPGPRQPRPVPQPLAQAPRPPETPRGARDAMAPDPSSWLHEVAIGPVSARRP